ncbi:MAG: PrkA family serine protein kinase, partial [Planctomycetota bacterium]
MSIFGHSSESDSPRRRSSPDPDRVLRDLAATAEERFRESQIIQSFDEFLADALVHPRRHTRTAAQYLLEAIDHFGTRDVSVGGQTSARYRVFDGIGACAGVHGQLLAQQELVKSIKVLADKGRNDKLIMLHGPNGSAKSSTVECLVTAMEAFSHEETGALYTFNWIFSEAIDRDRLGFAEGGSRRSDTYAYLPPDEVSSRIPCELHENPLLLIPVPERSKLLREAYRAAGLDPESVPPLYLEGDLSRKSREIYDTLMTSYQGDWTRVMRHVQVERFFVSKRYQTGVSSIEPQRNVDASARPINRDDRKTLPVLLQNATLYEPIGELVSANRGLVEYSDFFKRPLEVNKYLLTTIEKNTITLPGTIAYLDVVMIATANEKNLGRAKRDPDFTSFKGRFELVSVPYLLESSQEAKVYGPFLETLGREKMVAPHTATVAALWAVLTRIKRPRAKNYPGSVGALVGRLSPIEKARLYDRGETPDALEDRERRELLQHLSDIRQEFCDQEEEFEGLLDAAHEGRRGVSPREMLSVIAEAASYADFPCVTPLAVIRALRELVKDVSVFDFLRLTPQAGYHDAPRLIDDVADEHLRLAEEDVHDALELVSASEYERLFDEYFEHVRA